MIKKQGNQKTPVPIKKVLKKSEAPEKKPGRGRPIGAKKREEIDLALLKQTMLLDNVESLIQDKHREEMAGTKELVIPYTPSKHQLEVHDILSEKRFGVVVVHRGWGKQLTLDTPIAREDGLVPLSEIKEGDKIYGSSGLTTVKALHPIRMSKVFQVKTSGGIIEACKEHLWTVSYRYGGYIKVDGVKARRRIWEVVTTEKLADLIDSGKHVFLPKAKPVTYGHKDLPIDPYVLGLWLGDGSSSTFKICGVDLEIASSVESELAVHGERLKTYINKSGVHYWSSASGGGVASALTLKLKELNLLNNKHIPNIYKYSSIEQRMELVRGLMDSDGTSASEKGKSSSKERFDNKNSLLVEDFKEVLASLAVDTSTYINKGGEHAAMFKADFNPFKLKRKADKYTKPSSKGKFYTRIKQVIRTEVEKPMRCITVDAEDSLYLAGRHYVLTHNTWLAINELIKRAWSCNAPQGGKFIYVAPEKAQAKEIAWSQMKYFVKDLPHTVNESELVITFPNSSVVRLAGADNPDRLRGIHPHYVVIDEVAQMPKDLWYEVVYPSLRANNGGCLFIGTPKGDNLFKELFEHAKNAKNWFAYKRNIFETEVASAEEIEELRQTMPQAKFEQEYLCSFDAAIQGTYFSNILERFGIVGDVPWDPSQPVITAWDLGTTDATVIWFVQRDPKEPKVIRIIDYYEKSEQNIFHYIQHVKSKPYTYDYHILPHDVTQVSWETGRTRVDLFKQHGMPIRIAKKVPVQEGISMAQTLLHTARIDAKKCYEGIRHLHQYRAKQDRMTGQYLDEPVHDQHSHAADALRTLAVGLKASTSAGAARNAYALSDYDYFDPGSAGRLNDTADHDYDIFNMDIPNVNNFKNKG